MSKVREWTISSNDARERTISSSSTKSQNAYLDKKNSSITSLFRKFICFLFTVNTPGFIIIALLGLIFELILCFWIVSSVPCNFFYYLLKINFLNFIVYFLLKILDTEIDWSTYMEQVQVYMKGEKNYSKIGGATGPLV